jgi:hypothetical protein
VDYERTCIPPEWTIYMLDAPIVPSPMHSTKEQAEPSPARRHMASLFLTNLYNLSSFYAVVSSCPSTQFHLSVGLYWKALKNNGIGSSTGS